MSQTDLAKKLGMKPQQVQRYEATDYMGASLGRLIEISKALGMRQSASRDPSKIAGRIRKERNNYTIRNDLVARSLQNITTRLHLPTI